MLNEKIQKANRRKFLLLPALMCAPVIISYALYFLEYRPESKHYGDLIPIVKVAGKGKNQADNTILRMPGVHCERILVTDYYGCSAEAC